MSQNIVIDPETIITLQKNVLFIDIDVPVLTVIAEILDKISVNKGDKIYEQGSEANGLYLVAAGEVQIYSYFDQKKLFIYSASETFLFGEFLLLGDSKRSSSAEAARDSTLYYFSIEHFKHLHKIYPAQFETIATRLVKRLSYDQTMLALHLSPLFLDLGESIVRDLVVKKLKYDTVDANTMLYEEGLNPTELCIVVNGRFRITKKDDTGKEIILHTVGRGETIGEIGVLGETRRNVDIWAVRDSTVAKLSRESFEELLCNYPLQINRAFSKSMINRLLKDNINKSHTAETFAVVILSPSIIPRVISNQLFEAFLQIDRANPTSILDSELVDQAFSRKGASQTNIEDQGDNDFLVNWLSEWEMAHKNLIYVTDTGLTNWTLRCLRGADHVVFIADGSESPAISPFEQEVLELIKTTKKKQTLLLLHSPQTEMPTNTASWLNLRTVDIHHHVRQGNQLDFQRAARFLTGKALGLVLGGGGARGFAHIGILKALNELDIPVDFIGGNSMGALIAAQNAMQWEHDDMTKRTIELCLAGDRFTLPIVSLFSGQKFIDGLHSMFGDKKIEDLWQHFYSVSCNMSRAEVEEHTRGSLLTAVLNSNTPPGLLPPRVDADGDLLVDGAILNNVPADVMRNLNEGGPVIAVDVNEREDLLGNNFYSGGVNGWQILLNILNPFIENTKIPNIIETLSRASIIGSLHQRKSIKKTMKDNGHLYLQPPVGEFSLMAYKEGQEIADKGYLYGIEELKKWQTPLNP
jgi:NTE family protein/lysophospholipid hydrolase